MDILSHMARIRHQEKNDELMRLLLERDVLFDTPPEQLYFWRAEISNDLLDSHFTHMSERTLRNYVQDAIAGVAFLKGHDRHSLPLGYSLASVFETASNKKRVITDFYTVMGLPDTDDLIARMKTGLVRDVSVGFYGGEYSCDLCGEDFWTCRHYPGFKYEVKTDGTVRNVVATMTIDDARLSEVSGVFDGSTPEAMILKAQRHAAQGLLDTKQTEILEQRYRISLPSSRSFAVPTERKNVMEEKDLEKLRTVTGMQEDSQIVPYVEALQRTVEELKPLAEQGRQYHADEVKRALAEGVRAYGNDFKSEDYEKLLKDASIPMIQRMAADFKKVADNLLPKGRSTTESGEEPPAKEKAKTRRLPDEAYA